MAQRGVNAQEEMKEYLVDSNWHSEGQIPSRLTLIISGYNLKDSLINKQ